MPQRIAWHRVPGLVKRVLLVLVAALLGAFVSSASASAAGGPVDFELAPPTASASASGSVTSRPRRTLRSFNLVGMRWRGGAEPHVHVRVRADGKRWTRWAELDAHADHNPDAGSGERMVAASDPAWVGEADQVQYKLSRRVPGLRLHFVNVGRRARGRAAQIAPPPPHT